MSPPRPRPRWTVLINGAFLGAVIGVFFAANGFCAEFSMDQGHASPGDLLSMWAFVLIVTGMLAGPGALVLGLLLTRILLPFAGRFSSRRRFLLMGMATGLPLGLVNLFVGVGVMTGSMRWTSLQGQELAMLLPALAGGAGLGLGCALAIPFRHPTGQEKGA